MFKKTKLLQIASAIAVGIVAGVIYAQTQTDDAMPTKKTAAESAREVHYKIVNIEYQGTKVWVPSVLIAPKGATVHLKLINDTPSGVHGFAIPTFNVKLEVANKQPKEVSFVAHKAGLHAIECHLHPAHIGGQLLVLEGI